MINLLARGLLAVAGVVVGWFVARDAPNFGLIQMVVGLLLLVLFVFIVAFWPASWTLALTRRKAP
jgi:hypothetical protein